MLNSHDEKTFLNELRKQILISCSDVLLSYAYIKQHNAKTTDEYSWKSNLNRQHCNKGDISSRYVPFHLQTLNQVREPRALLLECLPAAQQWYVPVHPNTK